MPPTVPEAFEAVDISYQALAPMIVLLVGAFVGVLVEAFVPRGAKHVAHLAVTGLSVVASMATLLFLTGDHVGVTVGGTVAVDGPVYERPVAYPTWIDALRDDSASALPRTDDPAALLDQFLQLLGSPNLADTSWITNQYDRYVQGNTALSMPDDGGVVRCKGQDLSSEEIQNHLAAGKLVTKLAVDWQERIQLMLSDDGSLKRLKFADTLREQNDDIDRDDFAQRFDADFILMTSELAALIKNTIEALGGEDAGTAAGLKEQFQPITSEAMVAAAPDVFLMMTDGLDSIGGPSGLAKLPGVAQTPAGRNERVVDMADSVLLSFGPNTGLGHNSMVYMIESQVQYIADCLRVLRRRKARTMNLRADVQREFNERLQKQMQHSVWVSGCHSWYQTKSGKVTALWPGFTFSFRKRTRRVRPHDYRFAP